MDKVFYTAGDIVTIKHPLPNKPIMLVKGKETKAIKDAHGAHFLGIKCFWFTTDGTYQENIFSTKDLEHVDTSKTVVNIPFVHTPSLQWPDWTTTSTGTTITFTAGDTK